MLIFPFIYTAMTKSALPRNELIQSRLKLDDASLLGFYVRNLAFILAKKLCGVKDYDPKSYSVRYLKDINNLIHPPHKELTLQEFQEVIQDTPVFKELLKEHVLV